MIGLQQVIVCLSIAVKGEFGGQDRRAELADGVDAALLAEYERLRPAFGAATAVTFEGGACVGCPSSMPAMEVDRLRHLDGDEPDTVAL